MKRKKGGDGGAPQAPGGGEHAPHTAEAAAHPEARGEQESYEGEGLRRRAAWFNALIAPEDRPRVLRELARYRTTRARMRALPRSVADQGGTIGKAGREVRGPADAKLRLARAENPAKTASWGHTGVYYRVSASRPFAAATLRFELQERDVRHLHAGSVVVARWDEAGARFRVVPQSGYDEVGRRAYARISAPGTYTAIGLPRDPRLLTTLRLLAQVRPWLRADPKLAEHFVGNICQLILCADVMRELGQDGAMLGRLGLERGDLMGGFGGGGDVCQQCLGIGGGGGVLPELDILDAIDVPGHVVKPHFPFRPWWPRPCSGWTNMGPRNVTGRIGTLAIDPNDGDTLWAGTTGGGVWRTTDGGVSWQPTMSQELSLAIGGLGIAASNSAVLYAATGEWTAGIGAPTDPVTTGVGVYRTSNGGGDWDLCAPIPSEMCAAVAVDPTNPDRVFVAGDTGLHRSRDGGVSWDVPVGRTNGVFDGEVSDVVLDPNDVDRLYIGVHRDGVYRSTDGGASWTRLQNGIATGAVADAPKIALGRNGSHGSQFVAVKMGERVYTSVDGGGAFTRRTDVGGSIWYFAWTNVIAVDPADEDVLLAGAVSLFRSTDGGSSWSFSGGPHSDNQAVAFDPADSDHVYVATDGGIWASTDNGVTWAFRSQGLVATHFYNMAVSETATLRYAGAVQDDDGFAFTGAPDWTPLGLGEGGYLEYDPSDESILYHDPWFTDLRRSTAGNAPWGFASLGVQTDLSYGEPLAIGRTNPNLLLAIKNNSTIARSTNAGTTWTDVLSPGVSFLSVRVAPSNDQVAYAGSTGGRVWLSQDSGSTWTELDTAALPDVRIQSLCPSPSNPRRVYVAFGGTGIRHLYRGDVDAAGNVTWFDASGVLPAVSLPDLPLTGLALHPTLDEVIYVSTLLGVLRSVDGGDSWAPFDDGLPNAFISDLDMRARDASLWVSTMGRGIYRRYV
jgi:hypothetical protein